MSENSSSRPWTPEERAQIRQIFRYAAWIFGAIILALIVASILASVFNLEAGAGTTTNSDPEGTPVATEVTS